jgi:hypothetical protein
VIMLCTTSIMLKEEITRFNKCVEDYVANKFFLFEEMRAFFELTHHDS